MKQAHLGEAGISAGEQYATLAAVLVDPGGQAADAARLIAEATERLIPAHLRADFVFHAREVFDELRAREGWDNSYSNTIMDAWLAVAHNLEMPVVLSFMKKPMNDDGVCPINSDVHLAVLADSIQCVDEAMETWFPDETASLIAEDLPVLRDILQRLLPKLRGGQLAGKLTFKETIRHINNDVLFSDRRKDPLIQIADAYAFAFKRYLEGSPEGSRFWSVMSGLPEKSLTLGLAHHWGGHLALWKRNTPPSGSAYAAMDFRYASVPTELLVVERSALTKNPKATSK